MTGNTIVRMCPVAAFAIAATLAASAQADFTPSYQLIALSGSTNSALDPNMGAGVTFFQLGQQQPSINYTGAVLFRGQTSAAGNPSGLWLRNGATNQNIAMAGGAQPGGGTFPTTAAFNSASINNNAQVAFRQGAGTGLFSDIGSGMGRVMNTGDVAPGTGGATYSSVASGTPFFNSAGQTAYVGSLNSSSTSTPPVVFTSGIANSSGIWVGTPGANNQTLVLRQNDALTSIDTSGNTRVGSFSTATMSFNGGGRYVIQDTLQSSVSGTIVTGTGAGSNSVAILSNRTGSTEVIARVGNAVPNASGVASATEVYRTFSGTTIGFNDDNRVAFIATIRNGATNSGTGLYSDTGTGVLRQIYRSSDALPAVTGAVGNEFASNTWSNFSTSLLNSAGTIAFSATLADTGGLGTTAIFTMTSTGQLSRVVRSGDVAVVGGSPVDGSNVTFTSFANIAVNGLGQVAFTTQMNGNGVSPGFGNGSALFAVDHGERVMIARTGDLFEVAPGDNRTIRSIGGLTSGGGQDGRAISFNDRGQLVFQLEFANNTTGIFVATIPSAGTLPLLGLGLLAARRRR